MESEEAPMGRLLVLLVGAISVLLVALAVLSVILLVRVEEPGVWDDAGSTIGLAASILGLLGMAHPLTKELRKEAHHKTRTEEALRLREAVADLRYLTTELKAGRLAADDLDVDAAAAEVDAISSQFGTSAIEGAELSDALREFMDVATETGRR